MPRGYTRLGWGSVARIPIPLWPRTRIANENLVHVFGALRMFPNDTFSSGLLRLRSWKDSSLAASRISFEDGSKKDSFSDSAPFFFFVLTFLSRTLSESRGEYFRTRRRSYLCFPAMLERYHRLQNPHRRLVTFRLQHHSLLLRLLPRFLGS